MEATVQRQNPDGLYVVIAGRKKNDDPGKIVQVHDGNIHLYKDTPADQHVPYGVIVTEKEYSHYRLRFQYKWGVKKFPPRAQTVRDAGLLYHVIGDDVVWPTSVECQVQEGDTGDVFTVYTRVESFANPSQPDQYQPEHLGGERRTFGAPRHIARVVKSDTHEIADDWNTVETVVRGGDALHIVNGKVNNRRAKMQFLNAATGKREPLTRGRIAFQAEAAEVFYRNIEIMELDPAAGDNVDSPP